MFSTAAAGGGRDLFDARKRSYYPPLTLHYPLQYFPCTSFFFLHVGVGGPHDGHLGVEGGDDLDVRQAEVTKHLAHEVEVDAERRAEVDCDLWRRKRALVAAYALPQCWPEFKRWKRVGGRGKGGMRGRGARVGMSGRLRGRSGKLRGRSGRLEGRESEGSKEELSEV